MTDKITINEWNDKIQQDIESIIENDFKFKGTVKEFFEQSAKIIET